MNATPPLDEEQIRVLLDDAVSDVEPRAGLDEIRARTTVRPLRRRRGWMLGAGAAVVATAATVAVVASLGGSPGTDRDEPGFAAHTPTTATSASPGTTPVPSVAAPVYYVGDTSRGPRLYREFDKVRADRPLAMQAVGNAVGVSPGDPDYGSPWFGHGAPGVLRVTHRGGLITVDLATDYPVGPRPSGMTAVQARLAVQQVVYTAQGALQSRDPVRILVNDDPVRTIFGVPTVRPVAHADPGTTLAQVWVTDPSNGQVVTSPFTVTGVANAFEANVQWELMRGGAVVRHGFTTAQQCCTMAPYSFTVKASPGRYTLVVHDSDASGGAGPAPWQDTKVVTVR